MRRWLWGIGVVALVALSLSSALAGLLQSPADFPTSLHATRQGKITAYSAENGGAELITGIPIQEVGCLKCHPGTYADGTAVDPAGYEPGCKDCHAQAGDTPSQEQCLKCHGRQGLEIKLGYGDVHRDAGMVCTDCHGAADAHGDGTRYASFLDPGAVHVSCDGCHREGGEAPAPPASTPHSVHGGKLDCTACHSQTTVTCFNCHFESIATAHVKRMYGPVHGYQLLLNRKLENGETRVYSGTFMAVTYRDESFYVLAPFRSHTLQKEGRACNECHANANLQQYRETGTMTLTRWDPERRRVIMPQGVIPVPPDWQEALLIDFVTYTAEDLAAPTDPEKWEFLKSGADVMQLYYAEPLTEEQMQKLLIPMGQ